MDWQGEPAKAGAAHFAEYGKKLLDLLAR